MWLICKFASKFSKRAISVGVISIIIVRWIKRISRKNNGIFKNIIDLSLSGGRSPCADESNTMYFYTGEIHTFD